MIAVIYGYPSTNWECEKCNTCNTGAVEACHECKAPRAPNFSIAEASVADSTTTRMYREPRETRINFMPITIIALTVGVVLAICLLLYWWLG